MSSKKRLKESSIDLIGIGNAIVDVLVQVEDSVLESNKLKKGSMVLIDEKQAEDLLQAIGPGLQTSGGSAANTLAGFAALGGKAGFIGRVKNDELGHIFTNDIRSVGTKFSTAPTLKGPSTARCLILVTPDAQRTMCTYLGASVQLEPEDVDLEIVAESKILYLEGYLWDSPSAKKAFVASAELSKKSGGQVALSLSDAFCVDRHRKSFIELVNNHIDILFANESEIISLYQTSSFEEALREVKNKCKIAAITRSDKGSVILERGNRWEIPAFRLGPVIDTTGAGDLYAGGFLHGYIQGANLFQSGCIGSLCAGQIVTQLGPRSEVCLRKLLETNL